MQLEDRNVSLVEATAHSVRGAPSTAAALRGKEGLGRKTTSPDLRPSRTDPKFPGTFIFSQSFVSSELIKTTFS